MVGLLALLPQAPARAQAVDVAIVLAVDVSASVDAGEYGLQMRGVAEAIAHPTVTDAIEQGEVGAVAFSVVQWSSEAEQAVAVPWTRVDGVASAQALAARIWSAPRAFRFRGTKIGAALRFCFDHLDRVPFPAARRVVDVSGDGVNRGPPLLRDTRAEAIRRGITINGLPILSDEPRLGRYFRDWLIAGPGAFVIAAESFEAFRPAMVRKLVREIRGMPMVSKR